MKHALTAKALSVATTALIPELIGGVKYLFGRERRKAHLAAEKSLAEQTKRIRRGSVPSSMRTKSRAGVVFGRYRNDLGNVAGFVCKPTDTDGHVIVIPVPRD